MSTTNTDSNFYWYIRRVGKNFTLGIVTGGGVATSTADLDIEIWGDRLPIEITNDQDELPLPEIVEHGFIMGCVYELLRMSGKEIITYKMDFEKAIGEAIHYNVHNTQQPMVLKMPDLRDDY
jgi:hypothetical protein